MRRVVSLWFPKLSTERIRRKPGAPSPEVPLVTVMREGPRRILMAVDGASDVLGLAPGISVTQAQALVPKLHLREADPSGDARFLHALALACLQFSPLVAINAPDGLWLDVTGVAHLFAGEAALLNAIVTRCASARLTARVALADTPGAAWALARFALTAENGCMIVMAPGQFEALDPLPLAALRLAHDAILPLRRIGIERIADLRRLPRAPLARRFGKGALLALDRALGDVFEPIAPITPPSQIESRRQFAEPISTTQTIERYVADLAQTLCRTLEIRGQGARVIDLICGRVDQDIQAIRIRTAKPTREAGHIVRLLRDHLARINPGFGIESMALRASRTQFMRARQMQVEADGTDADEDDLAALIDRLVNRLGERNVYRLSAIESDIPERSVTRVTPLGPAPQSWPHAYPRPSRMFDPPEPIETMGLLPDHPPIQFTWRQRRYRVTRADGPERLFGEWWAKPGESALVRDYFQIEDERGARYWVYREEAQPQSYRWFLQGLF